MILIRLFVNHVRMICRSSILTCGILYIFHLLYMTVNIHCFHTKPISVFSVLQRGRHIGVHFFLKSVKIRKKCTSPTRRTSLCLNSHFRSLKGLYHK